MKKTMLVFVVLAMVTLIGCVQKHCFINPPLNREHTVTVGSRLVDKTECYGRVTVNDCYEGLWLIFLGKTGGNIRIQSNIGTASSATTGNVGLSGFSSVSKTPIITEILYPESSKSIEFQDVKIQVIEATESRIRFKLIEISTQGCDKVNGQEVK
jgi:hypothetical protein